VSSIVTRRRFITAVSAATVLAGCKSRPVVGFLDAMDSVNRNAQELLFSPHRLAPELPASAETPETAYPVYFIGDEMPTPPANWTLSIGGLVARPGTLTLEQLKKMPRTDLRVEHHCVEGWSAVAMWHGVRLSEIAKFAGVDPRARCVEFRSFDDDYWSSWDLDSAMHPQTILAYGMNGHVLTAQHGAPLRLYSAVKLGYKMVKYLTAVNFLPHPTGGYWEDQGYEWFAGV